MTTTSRPSSRDHGSMEICELAPFVPRTLRYTSKYQNVCPPSLPAR